MTTPALYLTPGFFITLSSKRQVIHLMLLTGAFRKATPVRLAVIDALNNGFPGDVESLIKHVAERVNGKPAAIREFVEHLAATGYLTDSAPPVRDVAPPSGTAGIVGTGEVNIATPV